MNESVRSREAVVNKIKRLPLVVFLKKILPILVFFFILLLTFLFGLWNVRTFNYSKSNLTNISEQDLNTYLHEYLDENIFVLSLSKVEEKLYESNGYVKDVFIKKVLPSKLDIYIEELVPKYLGYSSDKCLLFADNGELISEVCEKCEKECKDNKGVEMLYLTSDSYIESRESLLYYDEISSIQKVLSIFEYIVDTVEISNGIATISDTNGHIFVFDITYDLDIQLSRVYIVCQKIDEDMIEFKRLDLRFDRPVMRFE